MSPQFSQKHDALPSACGLGQSQKLYNANSFLRCRAFFKETKKFLIANQYFIVIPFWKVGVADYNAVCQRVETLL